MGDATRAGRGPMSERRVGRWAAMNWAPYLRHRTIDGRQLCYVDYGKGPPIVLVHGLGGSWTSWLENLPALAERHRVIAVDLPGFGASEVLGPGSPLEAYGHVVAQLIDELAITPVTLVGHSLGGLIVQRVAVDHSLLVERLVLVNAGGITLTPFRLALLVRAFMAFYAVVKKPGVLHSAARRRWARWLLLAPMVSDPGSISPELARETIPQIASPGFLAAVAAGASGISAVDPAAIRCPVLLLWGREDRVLPVQQAEELERLLPDARLQVFDDAAHCPMFEVPELFNDALLAFATERKMPRRPRERSCTINAWTA